MSNLTDLLPSGAGGKQVDFVATGTLASGQTVALKTDGTVEAVTSTPISQALGTPANFESANTSATATTYDSTNNKVVIAYSDWGNSKYGTAVVGTVSGTAITFGTPVVFESAQSDWLSATFDSVNSKVVIAYSDAGNATNGTAIIGTVSGTTISFGTAVVYNNTYTDVKTIVFDNSNNKVVIAYNSASTSGKAIVGTVSGTSISFGSAVVFNTGSTGQIGATFDSNENKVIIAYQDAANGYYGTAIVGTVAGTSISFGVEVVYYSANNGYNALTFDSSSNKVVIAHRPNSPISGTAYVGTVSGTSISFGSPVTFSSTQADWIAITYDSNANKVVISYQSPSSNAEAMLIAGTVSGTTITFGTAVVIDGNLTYPATFISTAFDSTSNKVITSYSYGTTLGKSIVFRNAATASNNTSFIGITDAAIADTATGSVTIKGGISSNVASLTPNSSYYVKADGALTTTKSTVLAGKALSSTSINLDYTT